MSLQLNRYHTNSSLLSNSTDHYSLSLKSCNLLTSLSYSHTPGQWSGTTHGHNHFNGLHGRTDTHTRVHACTCTDYSSALCIRCPSAHKRVLRSLPVPFGTLSSFDMPFLTHLTVTLDTQPGVLVMHGPMYVCIIPLQCQELSKPPDGPLEVDTASER